MNNYASMRNGAGVQGNLVLGTHVYISLFKYVHSIDLLASIAVIHDGLINSKLHQEFTESVFGRHSQS